MASDPTPPVGPRTIDELLALDLTDGRRARSEPPAPDCPHGMGSAKACVECMNEVGLGAVPRATRTQGRRWQDELPDATRAMLTDFGAHLVRTGQNTEDSADDYRGYVAQAVIRLGERASWDDLSSDVKAGCRAFIRWAPHARLTSIARQSACEAVMRVLEAADAR